MGTLTFAQLQSEVQAGLGNRTDLNSRLPSFINLAQQRIANIHDFDEMEILSTTQISNTGSSNDKYLQLPFKREVYSLVVLNGAQSLKLVQRTPQFWDRRIPMPEYWARDLPRNYMIWNNTIEIFPMPDQAYTLRCRWTAWPTPLVNAGDISQYINKDEVIIELALGYALRSLGKEDDALRHEQIAMRVLDAAIKTDDTKPDMQMLPGAGDSQTSDTNIGAYWLNPFVKD